MPTQICLPPHIGLPFDYKPPTVDGHAEWEIGLSKPAAAQNVRITGNPTGGTFVLGYGGSNTTPLAFNADNVTVQNALRAIPALAGVVVGGPDPITNTYTVHMNNVATPISLLTLVTNSLTGGAAPGVTIADVTAATNVIETGWTESARETFAYAGSSGLPAMSLQAIKHNAQDLIYLSLVSRLDPNSYNVNDAVVIVLQPSYSTASHPNGTRRLLIRPTGSFGAGQTATADAGATDFTDAIQPSPGDPIATAPVRFNHPVNATISQLDSATGAPTGGEVDASTVAGLQIRAKSWTFSATDNNWSVEVLIPMANVLGSGVTLGGTFGLYANVLRFGSGADVLNFANVTEFSWPPESTHLTGSYAGLEQVPIPPGLVGQASTGGGCQGVFFASPWGAIGVKSGASVTGTIDGAAGVDNVLVAELKDDGTGDAADVRATFRLANFGIGPGGAPDWDLIPATNASTNPTPPATVTHGGATTELSMQWTLTDADRAKYMGHGGDQCMWVLLDSDQTVMFKESSHRENLSFKNLSDVDTDVVISGQGHGPTADGGPTYDFLLVTNHRLLASTVNYDGWNARPPGSDGGGLDIRPIPNPQQQGDVAPQAAIVKRGEGDGEGDGDGGEDHGGQTVPWVAQQVYNGWAANTAVNYTWMAVTTAYRRTGDSLTLAGTEYPIYAVVDSFSHVLTHQGQPTTFVHTMDADGLTQVGNGVYTLLVPSGGQVVAKVKYSTEPLPPPTLGDKLDQIEDTVETAVQQAASKADAIEDAVERIIKPGQHET